MPAQPWRSVGRKDLDRWRQEDEDVGHLDPATSSVGFSQIRCGQHQGHGATAQCSQCKKMARRPLSREPLTITWKASIMKEVEWHVHTESVLA